MLTCDEAESKAAYLVPWPTILLPVYRIRQRHTLTLGISPTHHATTLT